ncbi:hypothetical protein SLEP1_g43101 [Rubroshorea leprosula]|uniref:Uncharacterized protein n=1 Tax=Rubroshorea leprosula TaxID=152421 RepID=A0AAV5LBX7_9ROSI|nr:hypothetical protein SLEP1_g43101 [Rubroshorea leprosula]
MATIPSKTQLSTDSRSNSLPAKLHPVISQVDEHLSRLRTSESASTSSSIRKRLSSLQDLHECIGKLLQLPLTQQALAQEQSEKWVEEMLDGSLRILDACSTAKDSLLHTKECLRELQSIMRRKRGGETAFLIEVRKYLASRKVMKKANQKVLKNLKGMDNKCNNDDETLAMVRMFKEIEGADITLFESLLSFISGEKVQSKASKWSLVSKLVHHKKVVCEQEEDENEFEKVDAALQFLIEHKDSNSQIEDVQKELQNLDSCIQDLEEGLECLFRWLIRARVSILNILNHYKNM